MKTIYVHPKDVERKWYLIDAENQILGKVAEKAATLARGKHKPEYVPHHDMGDYVVIINADKIAVTGGKMQKKNYYRHSGYPGGITREPLEKRIARKPTFPLENAVRGMLPKNRLGRRLFKHVKVYAGADHPHAAQQPEPIEIYKGGDR
ncbi:MAG: 50S ribosomal protein L13 [Spirochaetales bacterium]|nr:50S ribosomal protein L13 [Spirochaetales bacterium]MCF7938197.1 50S ribosomal protein L13 [Spirochaetales bacterium]